MTLSVAALQFCPAYMDSVCNRTAVEEYLGQVDAALAVVPELSNTGYWFESRQQLEMLAESLEGQFVAMLRDIARSRGIMVVAGFAEKSDAQIYNSAVTVLPDGRMSVYRKTHLFAEEKMMFAPGDTGFSVVQFEGICLGTMICYDWRFPEAARTLALRGADLICHPSALVALPRLWMPVMRTRSFENRVLTVTANRIGEERHGERSLVFHGCSQIVDVNGDVLALSDESTSGWIVAEVDTERARSKRFSEWNDIFLDRRPDLYDL